MPEIPNHLIVIKKAELSELSRGERAMLQ